MATVYVVTEVLYERNDCDFHIISVHTHKETALKAARREAKFKAKDLDEDLQTREPKGGIPWYEVGDYQFSVTELPLLQ